jgi:hypothetical protein
MGAGNGFFWPRKNAKEHKKNLPAKHAKGRERKRGLSEGGLRLEAASLAGRMPTATRGGNDFEIVSS